MNFGILHGAGAGEQLWYSDYGGLCGGGENRHLCLSSGAGFRQCLFYVSWPRTMGPGRRERICKGTRTALGLTILFSVITSGAGVPVCGAADGDFRENRRGCGDCRRSDAISAWKGPAILVSACLFLLYGYYRAIKKPGMSVVLTVISLGHPGGAGLCELPESIGVTGIWAGHSHRLGAGGCGGAYLDEAAAFAG